MLIAMCSNDVESFFYAFFCVTIYSCVSVLSVITADEDPRTAMFCNNCCRLAMISYKNKQKKPLQSCVSDIQCTSGYTSTGCAFLIWSCCSSIFLANMHAHWYMGDYHLTQSVNVETSIYIIYHIFI